MTRKERKVVPGVVKASLGADECVWTYANAQHRILARNPTEERACVRRPEAVKDVLGNQRTISFARLRGLPPPALQDLSIRCLLCQKPAGDCDFRSQ